MFVTIPYYYDNYNITIANVDRLKQLLFVISRRVVKQLIINFKFVSYIFSTQHD